ncbi:MAG: monovalent cation/H+ antiporter subunit D family protein [Candidatus Margulisiibacteriota bacterium]
MINLLPLFIAVPIGAAFLLPLLARVSRRAPDLVANLVTIFLLVMTLGIYYFRPFNTVLNYRLGGWLPPIGINLVLDGLSHLLLLVISLVAGLVTFYSIAYMEKYTGKARYYTLFLLMIAGMNGAVLTGDLFNLFIFLELAAIASCALVAFGTGAEEMEAAFKYLIMGTVASVLILFGIALTYSLTGTLNMAEVARLFPANANHAKNLIMALFLAGFATKAALMPFHAWLPDAHPVAPAPVSATLSGVLIKALGVYAIIRVFYNVLGMSPPVALILMLLGAASILGGSFLALGQRDLKRMLAYSSIAQVGYIVLGVSLGTPLGIMGGLFHLFNHAIFKPLLFLNAGAVEYATGTRQLNELGGLGRKMPVTANTSLIASLAISGLPPFNGFWSKLFIIIACVQAGQLWFALVAIIGSIMTLAYVLKAQRDVFLGPLPADLKAVREAPWIMGTTAVVMALLCLAVGLAFPYVIALVINPAVVAVANGVGYGRMIMGGP